MIAIDRFPERLQMAKESGAETVNYEEVDVYESLKEMTAVEVPNCCIDAVDGSARAMGWLMPTTERSKQ